MIMERTEIIEKLNVIFREVFNDANIAVRDDMTAEDVETWDSLTNMLMISSVEKTFGIKIKLREINKLETVGNLIDLIGSKVN